MTNEQVFALLAFAAVVVTLTWALPTSRPKLDGRQKYRRRHARLTDEDGRQRSSMSPFQIALATLLGGSASSNSDHGGYDEGDSSDIDSGYDGGGGDGGGE